MKNKKNSKQYCLHFTSRIKGFLATLVLVLLFSVPTGLGQFNFIADYIKINVNESAPPSIALEEVNASIEISELAPNIESTVLKVGPDLLPQLELEEFVISELEQKALFSNPKGANLLSHQNNKILSEHNYDISERSRENISGMSYRTESNENNDNLEIAENLTKEQLLRLKEAQNKYKVLDQTWNPPPAEPEETMAEKIARLNQQIIFEENSAQEKSGIIIRGDPDLAQKKESDQSLYAFNKKQEEAAGGNFNAKGNQKDKSNIDSKKENNIKNSSATLFKINGNVELDKKADPPLVFTPDHRIEVRRFAEGVPHEFGDVKAQNGTFSIDVQNSYGTIVAQLINSQGVIEGQDSISIQDIMNSKNKPHLVIKPVGKGHVSVASMYGANFQKEFFNSLNFDIFGSIDTAVPVGKDLPTDPHYADAESVVQVSANGHVPTTAVISLQSGSDLMLMPEKMLTGLTDILNDQGIKLNLNRGDSLIWGVVRDHGQPIEGATIIGDRSEPVYFGSMYLPDKLRTKTSESGIFVIVVNEPGWKDLFIQMENGPKMHLNVLTFPGKVSQVFADLPNKEKSVSIRTFDAFSGEPARARIQLQQVEDLADTGDRGLSVIQIPDTNTLSFINVFPEAPYLESRQSYTLLLDYLHIPLISKNWIDKIRAAKRVNEMIERGTVVGFVQNEDYLLESSSFEKGQENLVYFNAHGEIVSSGVAGGGFILFNQPTGFIGVNVKDRKNKRTYRKIAFPDEKFISVLNFTL